MITPFSAVDEKKPAPTPEPEKKNPPLIHEIPTARLEIKGT